MNTTLANICACVYSRSVVVCVHGHILITCIYVIICMYVCMCGSCVLPLPSTLPDYEREGMAVTTEKEKKT